MRKYRLTFTHEENWRTTQEALAFAIALREGKLEMLAFMTHLKGVTSFARYVELSPLLTVIVQDFKPELDAISAAYADQIHLLGELNDRIRSVHWGEPNEWDTPQKKEFPVSVDLIDEEVDLLVKELDRLGRTYMAQLDVVTDIWMFKMEVNRFCEFRDRIQDNHVRHLVNGLWNGHYGISNPEYPEDGRILFETQQVLRHRRAWDEHPEGGIGVHFYEPSHYSKIPFVKIEELK